MISINRKLATKLNLSILALVVPLFILALGLLFLQSRYFFRKEAAQSIDNALNTVMQQVRNFMTPIETATNANTFLAEKHFQPDYLMQLSRRIVQLNPHVNGCSITAEPNMFPQCGRYFSAYTIRQGDSIITAREGEYDYYSKEWYNAPRQLGKACWVDPFNDYNEGTLSNPELIASYCKPIYHNGQLAGVISTDLSFRQLSEAINAAEHPYPNAYYVLIGGDGRYLIHPDTSRIFKQTVFSDYSPEEHSDIIALGHEMVAGKQGRMRVKVDGKLYHVTYRPLDRTSWSLAIVCPDNEILARYYQLTYIVLFIILIGLFVISWLCRHIINTSIRPITHLAEISQRISEGHYDEIIPISDKVNVIGRLQNSFAAMQQSLNERMAGIQQATEEMQLRNDELVTARQKAEEAVLQKEHFIHDVTHQIRTPLNIILGFADVLKDSNLMPEHKSEISQTMKYNAMHLNRMVIMLFDTSEIGISNESLIKRNEHVSCNGIARECIKFTQERFPDVPVRFETSLPDDLTIMTNSLTMKRTIRELLLNAAKYSDGKNISIDITQTADNVRFIVTDTGPGLPEDSRDILFEPFSKANELSEGLGLGLPLTKRHAISLGGDLTLDTNYHDGCRFIVDLPK